MLAVSSTNQQMDGCQKADVKSNYDQSQTTKVSSSHGRRNRWRRDEVPQPKRSKSPFGVPSLTRVFGTTICRSPALREKKIPVVHELDRKRLPNYDDLVENLSQVISTTQTPEVLSQASQDLDKSTSSTSSTTTVNGGMIPDPLTQTTASFHDVQDSCNQELLSSTQPTSQAEVVVAEADFSDLKKIDPTAAIEGIAENDELNCTFAHSNSDDINCCNKGTAFSVNPDTNVLLVNDISSITEDNTVTLPTMVDKEHFHNEDNDKSPVANSIPATPATQLSYSSTNSPLSRTTSPPAAAVQPSGSSVVSWGTVELRTYETILADNPSVSSGPPVGIGWHVLKTDKLRIDDYERYIEVGNLRRCKEALILPRPVREERVLEFGYSRTEINQQVTEIEKVQKSRFQTAKKYTDGNYFQKRIYRNWYKTTKKIMKITQLAGNKSTKLPSQRTH